MIGQGLIQRIRACRLADLSDAMDAIGLVNTGTMSSRMRPLRPGIRMAGFAYTVKLVPSQKAVKVCSTYEEYQKELGEWCKGTYSFFQGLVDGKGKDKVVVIDSGCRDSYECNLGKLNTGARSPGRSCTMTRKFWPPLAALAPKSSPRFWTRNTAPPLSTATI